jgi:hypothetical protein
MIKSILGFAVAAVLIVTAFALPAQAGAKPASWTQRTCSAFTAWQDHPAARNLDTLVTDSLRLPHGYLAADVAQLLADSVTAKPDAKYVSASAQYVATDCNMR